MNTYLISVFDGSSVFIEKITARSLASAEDRLIDLYLPSDEDVPADWEDFVAIMEEAGYAIGNFYEISEF